MPEILTESFCERCGTRYTFESAAPRAARLSGIKVLSRGLKNFVMSDDTSMDEAMAAARSETDREVTSQQLDAFHKTFNFCMTCRQYTCGNCWNDAEGRCLTCAPHLGHEIMPAPFPDLPANGVATAGTNGANGHAPEVAALAASGEALAWPTMDLDRTSDDDLTAVDEGEEIEPIDAVARLAFLGATDAAIDEAREDELAHGAAAAADEVEVVDTVEVETEIAAEAGEAVEAAAVADILAEPEVLSEPETVTEPEVVAEPVVAAAAEPDVDVEPDLRAAAAATATNELMQRFRPGQSLDDEIEAYEREQAAHDAAAAAAGALAVGAITDAPDEDPHHATAHDAAAAAAAALAAGAARDHADHAEPAEAPAAEPELPAAAAAAARDDVVEQPTWQIIAPDPGAAIAPAGLPPVDPPAPQPTATRRAAVARPARVAEPSAGRRPALPESAVAADRRHRGAVGGVGPRGRQPDRARRRGQGRRPVSSRASVAGCHSRPTPGSAGAAGAARAEPSAAGSSGAGVIGFGGSGPSSRTRTQAAPYSSAWNVNDSQANAMNAVASDPANRAAPTSSGASRRNSWLSATIARPTMTAGNQIAPTDGVPGGRVR